MSEEATRVRLSFIPYGRQDISESDLSAVDEVLRSDWLTQGPNVSKFEKSLCDYTGATHSFAVSNGTAALHIACLALGVGAGDLVWTSPNTFTASANCALYCGADVDFVDIDPVTLNMSTELLEQKLVEAEKKGRLPKVVIAVHFAGQSCDMKSIKRLADQYGFYIIEDASHAIGGSYLDSKVGSCQYSDVATFSFHPVKIITTAEGGAVMTNSDKIAEKLALYRTHGITRNEGLMENQSEGPMVL